MQREDFGPVTPGEILKEEFLGLLTFRHAGNRTLWLVKAELQELSPGQRIVPVRGDLAKPKER